MNKLLSQLKQPHAWLIIILVLGFTVRLYRLNTPLADWHSWRQADTAAVTRNYVQDGLDLFHPRYDDISNVQSGQPNPQGWRMVEFPLFNLVHYLFVTNLPVIELQDAQQIQYFFDLNFNLTPPIPLITFEGYGRLVSILSWLVSTIFLYKIVQRYAVNSIAVLSAFFLTFIPYNIFYSRVILPEPMMIMASLGSIYFTHKWLESTRLRNQNSYLLLTAFFAAAALLLKPTAIFFLLLIPAIIFKKHGFYFLFHWRTLLLGLLIVFPVTWWRLVWIPQFPEGIPANTWLLNGDGIRLRPAWFRWLFYERIGNLILGGWGLVLLTFGLLTKKLSSRWFSLTFAFLMVSYLVIFATGNVRHDYYQMPLIPALSILLAYGFHFLWTTKTYSKQLTRPLAIFATFMLIFIGWYQVRGYYQINNPAIVRAGQEADFRLPEEAKVIAPYQGDTAFLYQINRPGWPHITASIPELIDQGATHYVSTTLDIQTKDLITRYQVVSQTEEFVIIDLTKPR